MTYTPKTTQELLDFGKEAGFGYAPTKQFLAFLLRNGLAIVSTEPTDAIVQAMQRAYDDPNPELGPEARMYRAAIAAGNLCKGDSDGG